MKSISIMTLLRRLGRKTRLLPQLLDLFPENITTFIDMFMGSGVVTFAMADRCKYVFANDKDEDVFNLFMVLKDRKAELVEAVTMMPAHESLFKHWKTHEESDPVWKAVRFLMLSNFGLYGLTDSFCCSTASAKKYLLSQLNDRSYNASIAYLCCDFRDVLQKIGWRTYTRDAYINAFVYADPPYLDTTHTHAEGFTEQDSSDLFDLLVNAGIRFAMSEFPHPFILQKADEYDLFVTSLGDRRNIKNRRGEILITNYAPESQQLSLTDYIT